MRQGLKGHWNYLSKARLKLRTMINLAMLPALVCILTIGCKSLLNRSTPSAIIDKDDREIVTDENLLKTVGKISLDGHFACTGFLVAPNAVAVAQHCVPTIKDVPIFYTTWRANGESRKITRVMLDYPDSDVVYFGLVDTPDNWQLETSENFDESKAVSVVGFSQSNPLTLKSATCIPKLESKVPGASSSGPDDALMLYDCDTDEGSSGSPVIQGGKVVGVHLAASRKSKINIAVPYKTIHKQSLLETGYFERELVNHESLWVWWISFDELTQLVAKCDSNIETNWVVCGEAKLRYKLITEKGEDRKPDEPLLDGYTCKQQAAFGNCHYHWMHPVCDHVCGSATKEPLLDGYTCKQQADFGNCHYDWMHPVCDHVCGGLPSVTENDGGANDPIGKSFPATVNGQNVSVNVVGDIRNSSNSTQSVSSSRSEIGGSIIEEIRVKVDDDRFVYFGENHATPVTSRKKVSEIDRIGNGAGLKTQIRPTLFVMIHGASNIAESGSDWKTFANAKWFDFFQEKVESKFAYGSNPQQLVGQTHTMFIHWQSLTQNATQIIKARDSVFDFLSRQKTTWDVVVIGHSRGGIFAHELAGEMKHRVINSVSAILLDPTAAIPLGDVFPLHGHLNMLRGIAKQYDDNDTFYPFDASGGATKSDRQILGYRRTSIGPSSANGSHVGMPQTYFESGYLDSDLDQLIGAKYRGSFEVYGSLTTQELVTIHQNVPNNLCDFKIDAQSGKMSCGLSVLGGGSVIVSDDAVGYAGSVLSAGASAILDRSGLHASSGDIGFSSRIDWDSDLKVSVGIGDHNTGVSVGASGEQVKTSVGGVVKSLKTGGGKVVTKVKSKIGKIKFRI